MSTATRKHRQKKDPAFNAIVGARIKARRLELGLTQFQVFALIAVSGGEQEVRPNGLISELESGNRLPGYGTTIKLCRALQWTPNDFFAWTEPESRS